MSQQMQLELDKLSSNDPNYISDLVELVLVAANDAGASDIHFLPTETDLKMSWRVDGVLHSVASFPRTLSPNITIRLKVLAELLTYRTNLPQEGRIRSSYTNTEMRISTFPTIYGEKVVVRLFEGTGRFHLIEDLGFPEDIQNDLRDRLQESGGIILVTGPAGSGKTTTLYACLRELVHQCTEERSLVSLEDPIEAIIDGVAQSQINSLAGFDYETGLKSLVRQDPEVIMVGEIRDRLAAETVFQASLTGHLVLTSFHAGSAAEAINRLSDMEIEPYLLRSGILAILSQRLVRKLCDCCKVSNLTDDRLGFDVETVHLPVGCEKCGETGYQGRMVFAEILLPNLEQTGRAILARSDANEIEKLAVSAGMVTRWQRAENYIREGKTSPAEVRRVLGFR